MVLNRFDFCFNFTLMFVPFANGVPSAGAVFTSLCGRAVLVLNIFASGFLFALFGAGFCMSTYHVQSGRDRKIQDGLGDHIADWTSLSCQALLPGQS